MSAVECKPGEALTILAKHFHDEPTFGLVRLVLEADIATLNCALTSANIVSSPLEHRLKSLDVHISSITRLCDVSTDFVEKLARKSVGSLRSPSRTTLEVIADEEASRVKGE